MISKSYDCFAPVSKFIPKAEVPDCHNLDLWMTINGTSLTHTQARARARAHTHTQCRTATTWICV